MEQNVYLSLFFVLSSSDQCQHSRYNCLNNKNVAEIFVSLFEPLDQFFKHYIDDKTQHIVKNYLTTHSLNGRNVVTTINLNWITAVSITESHKTKIPYIERITLSSGFSQTISDYVMFLKLFSHFLQFSIQIITKQ